MMNPEVIHVQSDGRSREVWRFVWIGFRTGLRLESYAVEAKTGRQRRWRITGNWNCYNVHSVNYPNSIQVPTLPADVIAEAKSQLKEAIDKVEVKV